MWEEASMTAGLESLCLTPCCPPFHVFRGMWSPFFTTNTTLTAGSGYAVFLQLSPSCSLCLAWHSVDLLAMESDQIPCRHVCQFYPRTLCFGAP